MALKPHFKSSRAGLLVAGVIVLTLISIAIGAYLVVNKTNKNTPGTSAACQDNQGIEVCIQPGNVANTYTVFITNNTRQDYTETFNTTCTEPYLLVNGQRPSLVQLCGQAITPVTLVPNETTKYTVEESGTGQLQAVWGSNKSGLLQVAN
jgi:hypothetical protein